MSRDRFDIVMCCLDVQMCSVESATKEHPSYDKLLKVRWLEDEIRDGSKQ